MYDQHQRLAESPIEKAHREAIERSMLHAQQQAKDFNTRKVPVTLVEHMTDPCAAQLQMMFASLDERGRKTAYAMISALYRLHKGEAA